ncbi:MULTISPECIES: hypothetical protein [Streptomyces]
MADPSHTATHRVTVPRRPHRAEQLNQRAIANPGITFLRTHPQTAPRHSGALYR